jgi:hypothetical protein
VRLFAIAVLLALAACPRAAAAPVRLSDARAQGGAGAQADWPVAATDPRTGRTLVAWTVGDVATARYGVFARFLEKSGKPRGAAVQLSVGVTDTREAAVAFEPRGRRFVVLWRDAAAYGEPARLLTRALVPGRAPGPVNEVAAASGRSDIALAATGDGRLLAGWLELFGEANPVRSSELRSQVLTGDGKPAGVPEALGISAVGGPIAFTARPGGYTAVWSERPNPYQTQDHLLALPLDPAGRAIDKPSEVAGYDRSIHTLAALPGLVAWSGAREGEAGSVFTRRLSRAGRPSGRRATPLPGLGTFPRVAATGDLVGALIEGEGRTAVVTRRALGGSKARVAGTTAQGVASFTMAPRGLRGLWVLMPRVAADGSKDVFALRR